MKSSLAILAVALLVLSPVVFTDMNADAADSEKCRFCSEDLYHCIGTAVSSDMVQKNIWVYPLGEDASMQAYIADPQNAPRPAEGLKEVVEGEKYDIYSFYSPEWPFEYTSMEKVLGKYSMEFHVQEKTVEKMTVTKVKDSYRDFPTFVLEYHGDETVLSQYYSVGDTATLNHYRDGGFYEMFTTYSSDDLFVEAYYQITVKEFNGSPYLYIGLSIGITAAIALLIFWCGRKPKL